MLITHARLSTLGTTPQLIEDGALRIQGETITDIGTTADLTARYPDEERWDARGQLVMPAAICGHTHFYGAFARGMAIPGEPPANFPQILERLWWRLDKALTLEDVRYSALVCLIDAIRHGTTTLIDHHASPNAMRESGRHRGAVEEAGLRASLCYEVTDRDGPQRAREGIVENLRFARSLTPERRRFLAASFGLHASLTLSDETLADCVAAARDLRLGFHVHVAEDAADQDDSRRRSGKRVVHRLGDAGVLGPQTVAVHCVHVDPGEIARLAQTGTWVTHQPRSNMNNGVGVAPVEEMLAAGVRVALGNDGFSNNMFAEMKAAYLVHKLARRDPRAMPGDVVMRLAYENNAALARVFWPGFASGRTGPRRGGGPGLHRLPPHDAADGGQPPLAPPLRRGGVYDHRHRLRGAGADAGPAVADAGRGGGHRALARTGRAGLGAALVGQLFKSCPTQGGSHGGHPEDPSGLAL
jgi:Cytosine deaminase and related metal-dependent hydrolases